VLVESTCDCGAGRSLHGANVRAISPLFRGPLELGPVLGQPSWWPSLLPVISCLACVRALMLSEFRDWFASGAGGGRSVVRKCVLKLRGWVLAVSSTAASCCSMGMNVQAHGLTACNWLDNVAPIIMFKTSLFLRSSKQVEHEHLPVNVVTRTFGLTSLLHFPMQHRLRPACQPSSLSFVLRRQLVTSSSGSSAASTESSSSSSLGMLWTGNCHQHLPCHPRCHPLLHQERKN
jgi:hypothetical protein